MEHEIEIGLTWRFAGIDECTVLTDSDREVGVY